MFRQGTEKQDFQEKHKVIVQTSTHTTVQTLLNNWDKMLFKLLTPNLFFNNSYYSLLI
jgi:hypothetical protein